MMSFIARRKTFYINRAIGTFPTSTSISNFSNFKFYFLNIVVLVIFKLSARRRGSAFYYDNLCRNKFFCILCSSPGFSLLTRLFIFAKPTRLYLRLGREFFNRKSSAFNASFSFFNFMFSF